MNVRHIETLNDYGVVTDVIEVDYHGQVIHFNIYEAEAIARRMISACYLPAEEDND